MVSHTLTGVPSIVEQLDLDDTATAKLRQMERNRTQHTLETEDSKPFYQDTLDRLHYKLRIIRKRYVYNF